MIPGRRWLSGAIRKIGWYSAGIIGLALGSLWLLKSMVTEAGPEAWASVALGQAIGGVVAILVGYGWGASGPALIARADSQGARTAYFAATAVRCTLLVPGVVLSAAIVHLLRGQGWVLTFLGSLPITAGALTAAFYYVGRSRPRSLFAFETTPRLLGLIVASGGLTWFHFSPAMAVFAQLGGVIFGVALSAVYILKAEPGRVSRTSVGRRLVRTFKRQRYGMASLLFTSLYSAAPVVIVSVLATMQLPTYTVIDRLVRQVSVSIVPVTAVFQGWIPRGTSAEEMTRRSRTAVTMTCLGGACTVVVAGLSGDEVITWLSAGKVEISVLGCLLAGAVIGCAFLQSVLANAVLPAVQRLRAASRAIAVGSLAGASSLLIVCLSIPSIDLILASVLLGSVIQCCLLLFAAKSITPTAKVSGWRGALM